MQSALPVYFRPTYLAVWAAALMAGQQARADRAGPIDFAHDIVPLIKARCGECHTNGKSKGGLSLDTRESLLKAKAAVPGKSVESEIIRRVTSEDPEVRMPAKGPRLSAREVELLRAWIDQGLGWQEGFSFKAAGYVPALKPRRPKLPAARGAREHPIDRIIDALPSRRSSSLPALADDVTFVRRAYMDVIGLLPAVSELESFLNDRSPNKRAELIRRLLADRRAYAEHWLSFWNDLLRNDYQGTGYIDGGRKQITSWLYQALIDNKPYDQFVRELIVPSAASEGFINGIKWRGRVNASQTPEIQFSQSVSQVFFGVNMKCASCHDSFIDTWKLDDAYGLAAVVAEKPLEIHRCDKATGRMARPRFLWPELGSINADQPRNKRLEELAALVLHRENGRFARTIVNRIWHRLMGRGIVHPVDIMANQPWSEDLLDYLASYLVDVRYDLKKLIEHIALSQTYQAAAMIVHDEDPGQNYACQGPTIKRLTAEQFMDAVWMITRSGPVKAVAAVKLPADPSWVPAERRFVRAALVNADLLMRSLGRPNREQIVTTRGGPLTTLQALDLSNGQILHDMLTQGASNLLKSQPGLTGKQWVETIYLRALSRQPTTAELADASELVGTQPSVETLADLLWIVVMLPEFQLIR